MRPNVTVTTSFEAAPAPAEAGWGRLFIVAPAEKGETGKSHKIKSLADHDRIFGERVAFSQLRDQLEAFFNAGGSTAHVVRPTHAGDVAASITIQDSVPATLVTVAAKSVGTYANGWTMTTSNIQGTGASSTANWELKDGSGNTLELLTGATCVEASLYKWKDVVLTLGVGTGTIVAATRTLASGVYNHGSINTSDYEDALKLFSRELGTGNVATPMLDVAAAGQILEDHCEQFNRTWISHTVDSPSASTIAAQGLSARSAGFIRGLIIAANIELPPTAENPTVNRTVAPEGAIAGLISKSDAAGSPARAAAGTVNGAIKGIVGPTQSFSDDDLDTLHDSGVNVIRIVYGVLCLYDFITPVDASGVDRHWLNFGQARAHAAVGAALDLVAERHQFALLSSVGGGEIAKFNADINGTLIGFFDGGTLFGDTPSEAFSIDTSMNTAETIAEHKLLASVRVKYAETNFWTQINITKVPTAGTI